jgi:hypothetical protein
MTFRHQDHFKVYEEHCLKLNISIHPCTTSANMRLALNRYHPSVAYDITIMLLMLPLSQGSLDNIVIRQPCVPPFSMDGLVNYLVELVVCEDKVNNSVS